MSIHIFQGEEVLEREPTLEKIIVKKPDNIKLRDYQREAYEACLKDLEKVRSSLLVLATGLGKSILFSKIIMGWSGRVLVLVHLDELRLNAIQEIQNVTGEDVGTEKADLHWEGERICVGMVQSVSNKLKRFRPSDFNLIIVDECFPAGSLVDGRPIQEYRVGDFVDSYNHDTMKVERKRISHVFCHDSDSSILRLHHSSGSVTCTDNHPVFTLEKGYINAKDIRVGMHCLRKSLSKTRKAWETLQEQELQEQTEFCEHGKDQPVVLLGENEAEQSDEEKECKRQIVKYIERNWPQATRSSWERDRSNGPRETDSGCDGLGSVFDSEYRWSETRESTEPLQGGHWRPFSEASCRSGWEFTQSAFTETARLEEGEGLDWVRVDSVEVYEQTSGDRTRVYNFEVEGNNNYFVEGLLVHNCHHSSSRQYREVFKYFSDAKIIGLTATDRRADGSSLPFDTCSYRMGIREGIDEGYLVPINGERVVIDEINLERVRKKNNGNFDEDELDMEMVKGAAAIADVIYEDWGLEKGILFFPGCASARLVHDFLNEKEEGISVYIDGKITGDERRCLVDRLRTGKSNWLCNVGIATEGFNWPEAAVVGMCAPTMSQPAYAQRAGRGTRPLQGLLNGLGSSVLRKEAIDSSSKPGMTILDFVGNSASLSLISHESVLKNSFLQQSTLENKKEVKSASELELEKLSPSQLPSYRGVASGILSSTTSSSEQFCPFEQTNEERESVNVKGPGPENSDTISEKQHRILAKYGIDDWTIPKGKAGKMMGFIAGKRFRLSGLDRRILKNMYNE